jgi:hypothetical protein
MKKALLILVALVMVLSGVAAASAYEAHIVNVKAKVENALYVPMADIDLGTVFPQEWEKAHSTIELSSSAQGVLGTQSGNLSYVKYRIYVEWKKIDPDDWADVTYYKVDGSDRYYLWLGEWVWIGLNHVQPPVYAAENYTWVGAAPGSFPGAKPIGTEQTLDDTNLSDTFSVLICVPVFEDYWNALTDAGLKPAWWPSEYDEIPKDDPAPSRYHPTGVDLGLDVKVQVVEIKRVQ